MSSRRLLVNRSADYWKPGETMLARPVDPRDQRWEVPKAVYRVYFWERPAPERTDSMWTSDEWRLEDAVEVTGGQPGNLGLVRLLGTDPADP